MGQRGILARLSDDVLALIFDTLVHGIDPDVDFVAYFKSTPRTAIRLSHISRRHRQLMLSLATMWTDLNSSLSLECVRTLLRRSKGAGLWLTFAIDEGWSKEGRRSNSQSPTGCKTFLDIVLPHARRWMAIHFASRLSTSRFCHIEFSEQLDSLFLRLRTEVMQLPRLKALTVHNNINRVSERSVDFYTDWDMPNLRKLTVTNSNPFPSSSITTFAFAWNSWFPSSQSYAERLKHRTMLRSFLSDSTSIRDLTLFLDYNYYETYETQSFLPIKLPNIITLSVKTLLYARTWTTSAILKGLHFPNLSRLVVELGRTPYGSSVRFIPDKSRYMLERISAMFPDPAICTRLKTVALRVFCSYPDKSAFAIQIPFTKMPFVEHFTLETDTRVVWDVVAVNDKEETRAYVSVASDQGDVGGSTVPGNLKYLRIERCPRLDAEWIRRAMESLRRLGKLDRFEQLTLYECPERLRMSVREFVPSSKFYAFGKI